jgi:hypothetical protein
MVLLLNPVLSGWRGKQKVSPLLPADAALPASVGDDMRVAITSVMMASCGMWADVGEAW